MSDISRIFTTRYSQIFRNLAQKWETTYIVPNTKRRLLPSSFDTEISTIEHLILLDLLGAPRPVIRSSFMSTAWLFDAMINAEKRLGDSGAFNYGDEKAAKWQSFFLQRTAQAHNYGGVEDDHVPFLRMGVDVLHVIANPFPRVWHTLKVRISRSQNEQRTVSHMAILSGRCICSGHTYDAAVEPNTPCIHVRVSWPSS